VGNLIHTKDEANAIFEITAKPTLTRCSLVFALFNHIPTFTFIVLAIINATSISWRIYWTVVPHAKVKLQSTDSALFCFSGPSSKRWELPILKAKIGD